MIFIYMFFSYPKASRLRFPQGAEYYQQLLKGNVPVSGWIEGPLAEACDLGGVSEMIIRLMTEPDFSNRLMDKCMVTAKKFAKAQIEAGCEITVLTPHENLKAMRKASYL